MKKFNYLFLTNIPSIAQYVELHGVNRIFVDLEINGKEQRQGHLDTVISRHSMADIKKVKSVLEKAELMVRLNPLHTGSEDEIEEALSAGADIIMQPMIDNIEDVKTFGSIINGRAKFIPLVETINSAQIIQKIHDLDCVDEIHIGLNDLHLELKLKFMFELIANGMVDQMVKNLIKPFGIGGIARIGEGGVPGEIVMAEHVRLGSSAVILSRAFHKSSQSLKDLNHNFNFPIELSMLEERRLNLSKLSPACLLHIHLEFIEAVKLILKD